MMLKFLPRLFFFSLAAAVFCLAGCKAGRYQSPEESSRMQILIGSGGGFSGAQTEYIILDNGQVFKRAGIGASKSTEELKLLSKDDRKDIFNSFNELNLRSNDFVHPGNMSYFIGFKEGSQEKKVIWGANDMPPPSDYTAFYDKTMQIITK